MLSGFRPIAVSQQSSLSSVFIQTLFKIFYFTRWVYWNFFTLKIIIFMTVIFPLQLLAHALSSIGVMPKVDSSEKQMNNNLPNHTLKTQKADKA